MKSESKLSDIAFSFTIDLNFTLISLKEFCGEIEKYLKNSDELLLKEEHRPELRNLWELVKEKELKFNVEIVDNLNEETLSKEELLLNKLLESSIYSMKVIPFYGMSVVYSFALFEGFLKDYLKEVFLLKPDTLKKRSKSIDYETLFDFENLEDIRFHIAAREVENIGYMNIDEIKDYLKNIFNISLNKMKDWEDFRENYFRRNVIVHNNSRISEIYVRNLKLPNERIGEILYSDLEYAEKCIINTLSCIYFIKNQIEEKLKLE